MSNVGAQLKRAREEQKKSRADVARKTGILVHDLAALEHGSYDALPDDETAAGFVKAYAEYLGFRPEEPVAEFWAERGGKPPPAVSEETAPVAEPSVPEPEPPPARERGFPWGWTLAGLVGLALVVIWLATRGGPEPPRVETEPAPPPRESTVTVEEETPPSDPEAATPQPEIEPRQEVPVEPQTEPTPAPPQTQPPSAVPATTLRVSEYGVGRGVENRRLTGESNRFEPGQKVWFWTRVSGGAAGDAIRHVWIHEGSEISSVELDVGNANWRTWSVKTMFPGSAGDWAVEARDADGAVLARVEFVCSR